MYRTREKFIHKYKDSDDDSNEIIQSTKALHGWKLIGQPSLL